MNRADALESLKSVLCDHDGKCCIEGSEGDRKAVDEALAALASDTGERGVVGIVDVLAAMAEAADLSPHSDTIDACSHRDPFEAYHMGFNDCRDAVMEALRAQPAGGGDGWFSVDVDALMDAATRAMTNCNFYAEIDGVAYSRLPTKDMTALGDVIMKAIGEKA